ncbi:MAG TPA: Maf family protein [Candidatus Binataceae bacterium]|nr:Maf family protein [Candidatus Binataceae bacterium]
MRPLKLILASGSPRRKALLAASGLLFEIVESGVDETRQPGESTGVYALRVAREKALAVSVRITDALVLAADTVVECDGAILGKPVNARDAQEMLAMLSAKTHTVVTAYALAVSGAIAESEAVVSRVTFRPLSAEEIAAYVATGEPLDKAGSYGIQGQGADFIAKVEGSRDNVMGLPMNEVLSALARFGFSSIA